MVIINDEPSPQLETTTNNNNDQGLLNKIFRRRSSASSRKSDDLPQQHKESLMQYLSTHSSNNNNNNKSHSHSRSNSNNANPCYRLSFQVGVSENKNTKYRPTMEDVHTYVANFAERLDWGYFAIFDGHAGKQTARWCGSNLHSIIEKNILKNDNIDLRINLNNSFIESDELIKEDCQGSSGSTAAVAILRWEEVDLPSSSSTTTSVKSSNTHHHHHHRSKVDPSSTAFDFVPTQYHKRMLYTANVGDSRLVLSRRGKALRLSYDHKGSDQSERERIVNSGGVVLKSRVNGMLAVTRSLGDLYMKDLVIGNPYTTATELTDQDEFLIIACDGLWDVCSDQKAIDLIRNVKDVNKAAKILCQYAMENLTTDNITVMVIRFDENVFKYSNMADDEITQGSSNDDDDDEAVIVDDDDEVTISNSVRHAKDGDDNVDNDVNDDDDDDKNNNTTTTNNNSTNINDDAQKTTLEKTTSTKDKILDLISQNIDKLDIKNDKQ